MVSRKLAVLTLLVVPMLASAQQGATKNKMGGSKRADWDKMDSDDRGRSSTLTSRDIANINPLKFLADKKKQLALTADQEKQIKDLDAKLKVKNDTLFSQLDSLLKEMKPSDAAPEVERIRRRSVLEHLSQVAKGISENYDCSVSEALPLLDEKQQASAKEMLTKFSADAQEMIGKKLGAGGRRGSGG